MTQRRLTKSVPGRTQATRRPLAASHEPEVFTTMRRNVLPVLALSLTLAGLVLPAYCQSDLPNTNQERPKEQKNQLKQQEKANKDQAKADKAKRESLDSDKQKKADKAQDKADKEKGKEAPVQYDPIRP